MQSNVESQNVRMTFVRLVLLAFAFSTALCFDVSIHYGRTPYPNAVPPYKGPNKTQDASSVIGRAGGHFPSRWLPHAQRAENILTYPYQRPSPPSYYISTYQVPESGYQYCGYAKNPRVVGGQTASPAEFPWMVSILLDGTHYCGGALIHRRYVVTAAHCVHRHNKDSFRVKVGEYKLNERSPNEHIYDVEKVIIHQNFVLSKYLNDIAVLRLTTEIDWDDFIQPICLPQKVTDGFVGRDVTVAGWGWLDEPERGGHRSNTLQKLTMKVVDRRECQGWYHRAGKYVTITNNHICAGFKEGGKDTCQGDSGGPLMLRDGSQYQLVGLVSAGIGCARPLLPGLYTNVSKYVPWLRTTIQETTWL